MTVMSPPHKKAALEFYDELLRWLSKELSCAGGPESRSWAASVIEDEQVRCLEKMNEAETSTWDALEDGPYEGPAPAPKRSRVGMEPA